MAVCAILFGCHTHTYDHDHGHGHGHDHDYDHDHEAAEVHEASHHHDGVIEISPERQKVLGISVDTVKYGDFSEIIHTSGRIVSATGDEMTVVAKSEGIVSLGDLSEGSAVGKGTRIATISSKSLGTGDKLAKARISYETAKKEYDRDLQLSKDNIVSESHLDRSRLEYEHAKAEYEALTTGGNGNGVVVTSPLSGFIKSLGVRSGDYVETGTPIATVSQNRRLRLIADVSEKYYGKIAGIKDANFKTTYGESTYSLKDLGGKLVSYGKASDGDFYIPVTFEFDNRGGIVPGSYVEVFLKASESRNGIFIPLPAVVEDQGVHYVFVLDDDDDDAFIRREVNLGQSDGSDVLVREGLEEGECIVVEGAVHVKLAGVASAPAGHTHNH